MKQQSIVLPAAVDISFLEEYGEVKRRLFIRLWNMERLLKEKAGAVYEPFLDFAVTCHIDVSDRVGVPSSCMVTEGLMEVIEVEKETLFSDAMENSVKTKNPLTVPVESYIGYDGFSDREHTLMIATTEDFLYGASVVMYPRFLEQVSRGNNLFLIPSSVHEWLYIEDSGDFTKENLTDLLRTVNREVLSDGDFLSDDLYYFDGLKSEMKKA